MNARERLLSEAAPVFSEDFEKTRNSMKNMYLSKHSGLVFSALERERQRDATIKERQATLRAVSCATMHNILLSSPIYWNRGQS